MPAPGATTIILYHSSTAGNIPSSANLSEGELAVNIPDSKIYTKNSAGAVVRLVGTLGAQNANNVAITGGTMSGVTITLDVANITGGTINGTIIGGSSPAAGTFTNLTATGTTTLAVSLTGMLKGTSGVVSVATADTDYLVPPSGTAVLKANSGVGLAAAIPGTDYAGMTNNQTFSASQRGTITTDNDLSFNMNVTNNFKCTVAGSGTLTFTNLVAGQSGYVVLVNNSGFPISAASSVKVSSSFLVNVSTAGTYLISYFCDGTNVYCTASGALS